jgi:hypothetical protein
MGLGNLQLMMWLSFQVISWDYLEGVLVKNCSLHISESIGSDTLQFTLFRECQ